MTLFPFLAGTGPLVLSLPFSRLWVPALVSIQLWPSLAFDLSAWALAPLLDQLRSLASLGSAVFSKSPLLNLWALFLGPGPTPRPVETLQATGSLPLLVLAPHGLRVPDPAYSHLLWAMGPAPQMWP